MAERKTTEAQDAILAAIAKAIATEKAAEAAARIEAEDLVRMRVREARNAANALIYMAERDHRITKSAIAKRGLGNTNRVAVDYRIREHEYRNLGHSGPVHSTPEDLAHMREASELNEDKALIVVKEDYGWAVSFDQFTHEDVGDNVSGEVHFDQAGQLIDTDGQVGTLVQNNPLLVMRIWGLEEVQAGVRDAR